MEISKAILALISIAINLRGRAARLEETVAEQAAKLADMQARVEGLAALAAKVDSLAPQTIDVPAAVVDQLTAAAQ